MSCFRTGGPGKEHGTNKPPPTGRVLERSKGGSTFQPPPRILLSGIHPGWVVCAPPGRTLSQKDWLKTTWKLIPSPWNPRLQATELFSWVPWPSCSLPGRPFPKKSLALSAHVSSQTIHFWVLDKSPVSGPGRGPPSCSSITRKDRILDFYATQATRTWETKMPERIKCV